ncbi:MAG: type I DNA topoisomerase [Erysipelotrichaceae bacterium]|nr:type I DNA topoisomerase [Erysipelotrichaceae bacterium]
MKNLVIVESPSKSKTIEKYLGKDYTVTSSKGHICDLATKGKEGLGVDIENGFKPTYEISEDKKNVVKQLKQQVRNADFVYLATDPDREGEAISWHLARELGLNPDDKNRIVFNEITRNAVINALEEPRTIDMALVRSQETRRILDRIIGFKLSKLLQKKIGSKSAGRVQSIALRMICDREKEINAFVPEEYWTIGAKLDKSLDTELTKYRNKKIEIKNEVQADEILNALGEDFILSDISEKSKKRSAFLPFITSTLQQEASIKLGFGSKKTMMVAQTLYEGVELKNGAQGLITYMRTDSTRLSKEFIASAMDKIEKEYGKEYKGFYRVKNDEGSQDAHEAIRPTSLSNDPESVKPYLSNDQYRLYKFIYIRALASLMADAVFSSVTYTFNNNEYLFTVSGSKMEFDGFLKIYSDYDKSKDIILPKLEKNDVLKAKKIEKLQHFTEAPSRYTEARLIKALEEEGVGRPSTYATIIDTIVKRNYVELKKASDSGKTKFFFPTKQGIITDEKLREYFLSVINVKYTADMESELDEIAENRLDSTEALQKFYDEFQPLVESAYESMEKLQPEKTGEICPECGGDIVIRNGKYGKFKSCINYPTCRWHESLIKKETPEDTGRTCPQCGKPLLKRKSRYGTYFIGCSGYPKCSYIEPIEGQERRKRISRNKDNES